MKNLKNTKYSTNFDKYPPNKNWFIKYQIFILFKFYQTNENRFEQAQKMSKIKQKQQN